jgi:S-DNA-T family DNA segregation ATPase FtsK/SpoIIIE
VYEQLEVSSIPGELESSSRRYRQECEGADPVALTTRPMPSVWSALEYVGHVRDVLLVQRERVVLALVEERPSFARMYRDERVTILGYAADPLPLVLDQLEVAARLAARAFSGIGEQSWLRTFVYNWPSPSEHDLAWLGRHTAHEVRHHLLDVHRILTVPPSE